MIKSISAWAFAPKRSASEVFRIARQHGFEAVEVSIGDDNFPLDFDSTPQQCAQIVDEARREGVQIASLASGFGWKFPLTAVDENLRAQAIERTRKSLQVAHWLGVDAMLLVPGGVGADFAPDLPITNYDAAYTNARQSLQQLAPLAEELGVTIGVENVWNKFLLSPLEFKSLLGEIASPRVGCYFDVGNVILTGYPDQWISILGDSICRVHFKDFQSSVGTLDGFCALGKGDVDFPAVIKALGAIGYDGFVTAEFFGVEHQLPAISRAMDDILKL